MPVDSKKPGTRSVTVSGSSLLLSGNVPGQATAGVDSQGPRTALGLQLCSVHPTALPREDGPPGCACAIPREQGGQPAASALP